MSASEGTRNGGSNELPRSTSNNPDAIKPEAAGQQVESSHAVTNTRYVEQASTQIKRLRDSIDDDEQERDKIEDAPAATTTTQLDGGDAPSHAPSTDAPSRPPPYDVTQPYRCPRCSSMDTKFSYYNNHNKHQPRYYCRGCQRHWTLGGHVRHSSRAGARPKRRKTETLGPTTTTTTTSAAQRGADIWPMIHQLRALACNHARDARVLAAQVVCAGVFLRMVDSDDEFAQFFDAMPMEHIVPAIVDKLPTLPASLAQLATPPMAQAATSMAPAAGPTAAPDSAAAALVALAGGPVVHFPPAAALMQSQLQAQLQWVMQYSGYGSWQLGGEQPAGPYGGLGGLGQGLGVGVGPLGPLGPMSMQAAAPGLVPPAMAAPWSALWATGLPGVMPNLSGLHSMAVMPSLSTEGAGVMSARGGSTAGGGGGGGGGNT